MRGALLLAALSACTPRPTGSPTGVAAPASEATLPSSSAPPPQSPAENADTGSSVHRPEPLADAGSPVPPPPPDMPLVPAGAFTMGADQGGEEDEHPAHTVTLAAFYLDRTEVTNAAYAECVAAHACAPSDTHVPTRMHAGADADFARPNQPVVGVTWDDAHAYCAFRGKRLPREAEFERAERDDDGRRYPWGAAMPTPELTAFGRPLSSGAGHGTTDDVGSHPEGRGPYGHDDLAGNVWEWMQDEYDPAAYTRGSRGRGQPGSCAEIVATEDTLRAEGKEGFTGSNPIPRGCDRVLRGGAFNYGALGLRSTNRVHHPGTFRLVMAGFRCAKDAP
jgi:formylglycine-generating enzyme required for sulfatase activity